MEWLANVISNIVTWGQNTYTTATTWVSNTINGIINWFAQLPGKIWSWLLNTINNVINFGREIGTKGAQAGQDLFNNIVNSVKELPSKMLDIGKNIVKGIWNGIKGMGGWLWSQVTGFASGIIDGMKEGLGIHSPSTKARDLVGKFIPSGVAVGVKANTDEALKAIDNMNNEIMNEMNKAVAFETGSINANASVKSNNSMLNVIRASFNIDGSVDIDGKKAGRILAPSVVKTIKTGGLA